MSIFAGTLKTLFAMFINNQIHLENRLKLLRDNLYQGPKTYNTVEGLKTYYESVLIEINQINEVMKASIDLIEKKCGIVSRPAAFRNQFPRPEKRIHIAFRNPQRRPQRQFQSQKSFRRIPQTPPKGPRQPQQPR